MNVLVLNASYEVLNVTRWQRAVCLVFSGKAEILETSKDSIRSARTEMDMPSVIRMVYYVKKPRIAVPMSRSNIFMRDKYTCQYCGRIRPPASLTLDHVMPRSMGGGTTWENLVAACRSCNCEKGSRTPEMAGMKLLKNPREPFFTPSISANLRDDWKKYVPFAFPAEIPVPMASTG